MASQGIEFKDFELVFSSANLHLSFNKINFYKNT